MPMHRIGSAENWVGYHVAAHLALHRWFVEHGRPVPGFLFLDQPSEIGFPSDTAQRVEEDEDREAVRRLFEQVWRVVQECDGKLQVIVAEHADFEETWFRAAVVRRWRQGDALIPQSWLDTEAAQ